MLPQLTVYAKIIYLLMVVISGALCTVEDYVIMSQCAHNKAIYLAAEGTVSVTDISQTQNITIVGRPDFVNNNFKIALYAKETQRYLCFNDHWKLVGMKELQDTCYFNEAILHGYFVFRSVVDQHRRIGFTQRGRAVGPKKTVNDACYMFTKIPTDQFFHQHNHFSAASKTRASTRTPPLTQEHSGGGGVGGGHLGRGSGGGRPNRHRNHQRSEEASRQHAKKTKVHNSGNGGVNSRKRQHQQQQQQRLQQMRGGHNGGGDPKNSTYLNSSRQNVELSQYGGGGGHQNHTGKHHNHSQPQYHQTRHHHNNESRRHHHEQQKQKTRTHHRVRTTSPTTTTTTAATAKTTTTMPTRTMATSTTSSTPKALDIKPTSVLPTLTSTMITAPTTTTTTTTSSTTHSSHDVLAATSVAHKRKGRRRKPHRKHTFHKSESSGHSAEISSHSSRHGHGHAATLPSYDDEDYITTDYTTWMNGDISPAMGLAAANSLKPTSATLPSWESWYPSSVTPPLGEEGSLPDQPPYSSTSISSLDKEASSSSLPSHYDISKNREILLPLPFPTTAFFAATSSHDNTLEEDEAIAPTVTLEDLTMSSKTINTSIFKDNENWSGKSRHRNGYEEEKEEEKEEDELVTKLALDLEEELNITREHERLENSTTTDTLWSSSSSSSESEADDDDETSEEASGEMAADGTTLTPKVNDELPYVTPTKSTEPQAAAPSTNKLMTDYLYATRTAPITGPHKVSRHRHGGHDSSKHPHNAMHQHHNDKGGTIHHKSKGNLKTTSQEPITTSSSSTITSTMSTSTTTAATTRSTTAHRTRDYEQSDLLLAGDKQINTQQSHHNTVTDMDMQDSHLSSTLSTALLTSSALPSVATTTTRKALRKSTQRLLATPFHQLTYVRNDNGDIDIDSLDNISMYPDLMDNENINHHLKRDEEHHHQKSPGSTSRFTMITGYQQPSAATSALPESIRIAKIKINRERKRMLRLRNIGGYNA